MTLSIENDSRGLMYKFKGCGIKGTTFEPQLTENSVTLNLTIADPLWTLQYFATSKQNDKESVFEAFSRSCMKLGPDWEEISKENVNAIKFSGKLPERIYGVKKWK